mgnify:CR=1 FL=1
MKKILGLDLGVGSIGWALVNEAEQADEKSSIIKLGVRVNPLTVDEQTNFEKGKPITTTAVRTLKRSMRRNLQRFKLRRDNLIEILKEYKVINQNVLSSIFPLLQPSILHLFWLAIHLLKLPLQFLYPSFQTIPQNFLLLLL